jgi:glutathione synthase/RimK-type ligase-like ATP-grasp enzyme
MRVAMLVPAPDYPEPWAWAYDVEAAALESAGASVQPVAWTQADDLSAFDLVLPLVAWGYQTDPSAWFTLLDRLEGAGSRVLNPVPVLRWNSDKSYLVELGDGGVPTIPTLRFDNFGEDSLARARGAFGEELVVKPPISASAYGTHRIGPHDKVPSDAAGRTVMVQPFLRSVVEEGEYSLILFNGELSHTIVKRAKAGDYRVQPHLGGTETKCDVPEGALGVAKAALAAAPALPAYARVDLLRLDDGSLAVIELELIEPSLWLQHAPDGGASFAAAVLQQQGYQPLP